ncbi:MAG TPA: SLATT domain-containing protein [Longimicrobium sp.]
MTQPTFLREWYDRVSHTQRAHYRSADHFGRKSYALGIPVIALSTLVGTSVFATLQKQPSLWLQIAVGLASVVAAVLASLQTFLGWAARAEKHRIAGAKYGAVGRELEAMLESTNTPTDEQIAKLREKLDTLALESPNNPLGIYRGAKQQTTG